MRATRIAPGSGWQESCTGHEWEPVYDYGILTEFLLCKHCGIVAVDADQLDADEQEPTNG